MDLMGKRPVASALNARVSSSGSATATFTFASDLDSTLDPSSFFFFSSSSRAGPGLRFLPLSHNIGHANVLSCDNSNIQCPDCASLTCIFRAPLLNSPIPSRPVLYHFDVGEIRLIFV